MPAASQTRRLVMAAATLLATATTLSATATDFQAVCRTPSRTYLLSQIGEVDTVQPDGTLAKAFLLTDADLHPYRWSVPPTSFTLWKRGWLVVDGSDRLRRFDEHGTYTGEVPLPIRVVRLATTTDAVWALNALAPTPATQLWRSTDGKTFAAFPLGPAKERFESVAHNMLILGGSSGNAVYVGAIIGPPVVHRVSPSAQPVDIPVAYSRTKFRAGLDTILGVVDDVTPYSLPFRDLAPLPDGGMAVLRNREDVRGNSGKIELLLGRRIDRYNAAGHQVATAELPRPAHFIVEVTATTVTAVSKLGDVVRADWGKAIPGEIVDP